MQTFIWNNVNYDYEHQVVINWRSRRERGKKVKKKRIVSVSVSVLSFFQLKRFFVRSFDSAQHQHQVHQLSKSCAFMWRTVGTYDVYIYSRLTSSMCRNNINWFDTSRKITHFVPPPTSTSTSTRARDSLLVSSAYSSFLLPGSFVVAKSNINLHFFVSLLLIIN